jgi:flagellar M-ring protein FliF
VGYQRALQGELARTISALSDVASARVHLVFPEESPFLDSPDGASASVVVTLQPGSTLEKDQIRGIVHLVSGAVKGLKPENVSIVDVQGRLLAGGRAADSVFSQGNDLLELQKEAEHYLEGKASSLLDGLLGAGRSLVRIRVDMDAQIIKEQTERYDPTGPVRSEQTVAGGGTGPSTVKNYEVGRTMKEIVASPGAVTRMYISLAVDGTFADDPAKPGERVYKPRTEDELRTIAQLVKEAVGFSEDREDQLEIRNVAFDTSRNDESAKERRQNEEAMRRDRQRAQYLEVAKHLGTSLGMGLIVLALLRLVKGDSRPVPAEVPAPVAPVPPPLPVEVPPVRAEKPFNHAEAEALILKTARQNPADLAKLMQRQFLTNAS